VNPTVVHSLPRITFEAWATAYSCDEPLHTITDKLSVAIGSRWNRFGISGRLPMADQRKCSGVRCNDIYSRISVSFSTPRKTPGIDSIRVNTQGVTSWLYLWMNRPCKQSMKTCTDGFEMNVGLGSHLLTTSSFTVCLKDRYPPKDSFPPSTT